MSKHWDFYFSVRDSLTFSILFDCDISKTIDSIPLTNAIKIKLTLKKPRHNGLSSGEELDTLATIENDLIKMLDELNGIYVGRITGAGSRIFHCFVDCSEAHIETLITKLSETYAYDLSFSIQEDKNKNAYWDLYPSEREWQKISNRSVIDSLKKNGDSLQKERTVDYCILFESEQGITLFSQWAESEGFKIESVNGGTLEISHKIIPTQDIIDPITLMLFDKAKEFNGDFDGWGACVVK